MTNSATHSGKQMPEQAAELEGTSLVWWQQRSVWIMLFLGFSAGLPILLIFSSLSIWLREAGVAKSAVTYFSWAALGYSFKFVWAPLVDKVPLPILSRLLGRRRGWLLLSQFAIISSIVWMALTDPQNGLTAMALAAVMLGFSSATQDVVIDAFRIESANVRLQAMLSSTYVAGYRIGMIAAGAGALYLAEWFGSTKELYHYDAWRDTYLCMAAVMLVGVITTLLVSEPKREELNSEPLNNVDALEGELAEPELAEAKSEDYPYPVKEYVRFFFLFLASILGLIGVFMIVPAAPVVAEGYAQNIMEFIWASLSLIAAVLAGFLIAKIGLRLGLVSKELVFEGYQAPLLDFIKRYSKLAVWVLLLVGFYRVSDIVMGVIANLFYQDMGYTKSQIASVTKVFGVIMTIFGSFVGGLLALRIGVMRVLLLGAVLVALTNLLFMWLAGVEPKTAYLVAVITADNLSAGIAIAAFIAWLSSLTNVSFTATQYALFSSLMTLFPKLLGGYSGTLVEQVGYANFFLIASCMGIPVIFLVIYVSRRT